MVMTPEWVMAICAGVTLLLVWTGTIIGVAVWIMSKLKEVKEEILADLNAKHKANEQSVKALEVLVIRHDTMLNPEFSNGPTRRHS